MMNKQVHAKMKKIYKIFLIHSKKKQDQIYKIVKTSKRKIKIVQIVENVVIFDKKHLIII